MDFLQDNRNIFIDTPLGPNRLMLRGFSGTERISAPFSIELDLVAEKPILFTDIIGKNVTVSMLLVDDTPRHFNGLVSRFSLKDESANPGLINYTATLVPWFWLLSQTADSRIFQNLSVPEIVEQIFGEKRFSDYRLNLQDSYATREYCVQYRETDLNFVSRLLEDEGIFYFFEHEHGKHTLVIADKPDAHEPCPDQPVVRYHVLSQGERTEDDVITRFNPAQEIRVGKTTLSDFNFTIPNTDMKVSADSILDLCPGECEVYDYPADFPNRSEGEKRVVKRMQVEEAKITTVQGESICRAFASGYHLKIEELDHLEDYNGKNYLLTAVHHQAFEPIGGSGDHPAELSYRNRFACIPHEVPFRPSLSTPRPMIRGVQTAMVVGPSGEEIYTDEYGRVKVQFHWDREGGNDENSSCWIRVSQVWAGAGWGAMHIPRMGHEVIVDFIEGDPDRPIITGRVYQANNMPPYPLPAEKTKSTIKSNSSLGGGGFNEIRFEDKKGKEEVFFHAQKNENTVVENDQTIYVGNDRAEQIHRDRSLLVERDKSETVNRSKSIQVLNQHTEQIGGAMNIVVAKTLTESVGINYAETVGGAMEITVGGALAVTVGGAAAETVAGVKSLSVGGSVSESIGAGKSLNVGRNLNETIKNERIVKIDKRLQQEIGEQHEETVGKEYILKAQKIQLVAKDQIQIKTGSAEILMKKNGDITIKGNKISVKGSGDVVVKGSKIKEN